MEASKLRSLKTVLNDRTLWYDGDSTVTISALIDLISNDSDLDGIYIDEMTDEIDEYNSFMSSGDEIQVKERNNPFDISWNIPEEYKNINVKEYLIKKIEIEFINRDFNEIEKSIRVKRLLIELTLFKKYQLFDVVRTLIYIINKFETESIIWGVGRGSSVSSYILYLIGVHDIDSVEFNLDVKEFLHTS